MGSKEVDGNGNVKVFTFTVACFIGDEENKDMRSSKRFMDYAAGWDWARKSEQDVHDNDPDFGTSDAYTCKISWDYDWIDEDSVEDFIDESIE